jgi:hypothetical protein
LLDGAAPKREKDPMIKAIAVVLVSILAAPSSALAQTATLDVRQTAIVQVSGQSSGGLRQAIAREAAKLTDDAGTTGLQPQTPPQRTWAGRHPVALGAIIGAAGGVTWGAVVCSNACEGGLHTPYWIALGAGVGAGIGAGIGAIISRIRS